MATCHVKSVSLSGGFWLGICLVINGFGLNADPAFGQSPADTPLRLAVFNVDATPPIGSPVAYAPARKIDDPLSARGVVLLGQGRPIVLCAVDWIGIGNGGYEVWREKLAAAAGTDPSRVAVHALHQHDGPRCDFGVEELLAERGLGGRYSDPVFLRQVLENVAAGIRKAIASARTVTHIGVGQAHVEKVASNRRILGPDGKLKFFRMSSYRITPDIMATLKARSERDGYILSPLDPETAMSEPEGVIDPILKLISFWADEEPLACLTYYATHPQSYFGNGDVTCEFVGIARNQRETALQGLPHIHFNGASGNIAAGKYNDGTHETRIALTQRMAAGMRQAWEATKKQPISASDIEWRVEPVQIPPGKHLEREKFTAVLDDATAPVNTRAAAARKLEFLDRRERSQPIELSCLRLKNVYVLHMPGELFIEYQLAARKLRPDDIVCLAAYGDYGTGYIGTAKAYAEGGYETGPEASNVAPEVEQVLLDGIKALLR